MCELSLSSIVNVVNSRYTLAKQEGYNNYAEKIWEKCIHKNPVQLFEFISNEIKSLEHCQEYPDIQVSLDDALSALLHTLHTNFTLIITENNSIFRVFDLQNNELGCFTLNIDHPENLGCWFEIEDSNTGTVNMNLEGKELLSGSQVMLLFHEVGHAIHHIHSNLETIQPDFWELGGILLEELCKEHFEVGRSTHNLKKDLALSLIDLELALSTSVTNEELIKIVEHIQNFVGVDISVDDFGSITEGQYGGMYWTYPYCRWLVNNHPDFSMSIIQRSGDLGNKNEIQTHIKIPHTPL